MTDANDGLPMRAPRVKASPGLVRRRRPPTGPTACTSIRAPTRSRSSRSGYVSETTSLTLAAGDDVVLDAALDAGIPAVAPTTIEVTAEFGADPVVREVVLSNDGLAGYTWEAKGAEPRLDAGDHPDRHRRQGSAGGQQGRLLRDRRGPVKPTRAATHVTGQPVLLLMDFLPWESDAVQQVLAANHVEYDLADSSQMASIDLAGYRSVIIGNDQPQEFYDRYDASASRFADYVSGGGFLWVGAASLGSNGGNFGGAVLPGGVTVGGEVFEEFDGVSTPSHGSLTASPTRSSERTRATPSSRTSRSTPP